MRGIDARYARTSKMCAAILNCTLYVAANMGFITSPTSSCGVGNSGKRIIRHFKIMWVSSAGFKILALTYFLLRFFGILKPHYKKSVNLFTVEFCMFLT